MRERRSLIVKLVATSLLLTSAAHANDDCPPGSVHKSQDGFTWCEPTVCNDDGQCNPNEVCRPVGLCMEVGTLSSNPNADGGKRLVVTQRCAPDKRCPQKQTCSEMGRCVTRTAAEKMGLLVTASPAPSAEAGGTAKKSSCGCDVVGSSHESAGVFALIGSLVVFVARRRRHS
jgi:hypothetical protein